MVDGESYETLAEYTHNLTRLLVLYHQQSNMITGVADRKCTIYFYFTRLMI